MQDIFDYEHPFVCTDAVVFAINTTESDNHRKLPEANLRVLLYKRETEPFEDYWCLPGGFLDIDELPEDNIRRKLFSKASVDSCWLEQLYTFCNPERDPRARVISIAYLGLMDEERSKCFVDKAAWFDMQEISESNLGFDHYTIVQLALERLRSKITYTDIAFNLLPKEFTLTQLQNVYEAIIGKKDQAANFRRKIMGMVHETGKHTSDKGHRPAKIYTKSKT